MNSLFVFKAKINEIYCHLPFPSIFIVFAKINEMAAKVLLEKIDYSTQNGTFGKMNYISCDSPEIVLARAFSMVIKHEDINDEGNLVNITNV